MRGVIIPAPGARSVVARFALVVACQAGQRLPRRLSGLPVATVGGRAYPVAVTLRSRLLGLAQLDRERAGTGLLIPNCRSVHTLGMRFDIDVIFLDEDGFVLYEVPGVPPRRVIGRRGAAAVLEVATRTV
jgi:uncharacterized membrane protein (UPF0127 family)